MSAKVTEVRAIVTVNGKSQEPRDAYAAWCSECVTGDEGVNWRGSTHVVGYGSNPYAAATRDAASHNEIVHQWVWCDGCDETYPPNSAHARAALGADQG